MTAVIIAFTDRGLALAGRLAEITRGTALRCGSGELAGVTESAFSRADAVIFVGAAGIAVRAIAPFVVNKASDPAVLVADEAGSYVIPILSGHLGGANELARTIASRIGAEAVITTATDINGVFAVDVWAKAQQCAIPNPERIKAVSAKLLSGGTVGYFSEFPIRGKLPAGVEPKDDAGCDFALAIHETDHECLRCVPGIVVLGIGCKKGTSEQRLETRLRQFIKGNRLHESAIKSVCTIDIKKDEPGLLELCKNHGWKLETFTADELRRATGEFSDSEFVAEKVGVGNVCERSAVLGSGGSLIIKKDAGDGVTIAAAVCRYNPEWDVIT